MVMRFLLTIGAAVSAIAQAQPTSARIEFDVASIKPSAPEPISPTNPRLLLPGPGSFNAKNMPLRFLMAQAYGVKLSEIFGGPDWINTDGYDIAAKMDNGDTTDVNLRLKGLLETRFLLKVHRETRQLPVLELTIAKGGPKLQPANCVQFDPTNRPAPGQPQPMYCGTAPLQRNGMGWKFNGGGITMADLIGQLSFGDVRWIDKTGFTEKFNVTLEWVPEPNSPAVNAPTEATGPSLAAALQEQLGLKLESAKAPVEVLVVDAVERPSAN